jgi:hypothetical protein
MDICNFRKHSGANRRDAASMKFLAVDMQTGTSLPSSSFATVVDGEARNDLQAL